MSEGLLLLFLLVSPLFVSGVTSRNFTIENKCDFTVWPGINTRTNSLSTTGFTGFVLKKGEARVIDVPSSWIGCFWGRSLCSTNSTGSFSCATGDCGSQKIECSGGSVAPPATLAEFALNQFSNLDYYDISVADGYNLPLVIVPLHTQRGRECSRVGCAVNLNKTCPSELKVGGEQPVACMSACQKFKLPIFCCTNTTEQCQTTLYSQNFKSECPQAYSYPKDDASSTFTCPNSPNYVITFCPSTIPNTTK